MVYADDIYEKIAARGDDLHGDDLQGDDLYDNDLQADDLQGDAAMKLLEGGGRRDQHLLMGFYACYATACMHRGLSSLQTSSPSSP